MSAGLSSKFDILRSSPYDASPCAQPAESLAPAEGKKRWVPSRYTVRASTEDGRLVLWNSYTGTMSVFEPHHRAKIEPLLRRTGFEAREAGIVEYLYKRGFLIPEGTDEYRRLQLAFGQQHYRTDTLQLILLASEDCNFRCNYCYEDFTRGTMQESVRSGIKKLVAKRAKTLRTLSISWFGGEPLYGLSAIEDLAPFFQQTVAEHGLTFGCHMTTNGYLLTPDVADKLLSWDIRQFQITLDGPPEFHDQSRPGRDGSGTFETIFANLVQLRHRSERFGVDLRVNFDRRNAPHLSRLLDRLEQDLASDDRFRLRFRGVGKWGGANDENLEVCGTLDSNQVQLQMRAEATRRGLKVTEDLRDLKGMGSQVCYAARPYNFIIGADGKVMKCTIDLDRKDRNIVGKISEEGDLVLDADKFALWTEPAFERDTQCQKCVILPTCSGVHCPQVRLDYHHSPCTPLRKNFKEEMRRCADDGVSTARKRAVAAENNIFSAT
ncbi:MAG: radical SAM protein [Thermoanaerobaculia bacterium]|nr:radical SAM protein [Thermoanaerobaculia bacterium]